MAAKVNCIVVDDEPIAREILENHLSKIDSVEVVALCKNAIEAFHCINTQNIDLIFLDINMPEISGLSFARSINKRIKVIFTTAYREYALDGFDLQAVDYLLKPISLERLIQALNKYLNENRTVEKEVVYGNPEEKTDSFFVRADRKMIKISYSDILFVESLADYVKIHCTGKTITTRETITAIEAKLPKADFLRVHRSYIVSLFFIETYTHEWIEIREKQIPLSRSYKKEVLERLGYC